MCVALSRRLRGVRVAACFALLVTVLVAASPDAQAQLGDSGGRFASERLPWRAGCFRSPARGPSASSRIAPLIR